jgi:hypothetical protein
MLNAEGVNNAPSVNALRNTSDYYTPENLEAMKKLSMNYNIPKPTKKPTSQGNSMSNDNHLII